MARRCRLGCDAIEQVAADARLELDGRLPVRPVQQAAQLEGAQPVAVHDDGMHADGLQVGDGLVGREGRQLLGGRR